MKGRTFALLLLGCLLDIPSSVNPAFKNSPYQGDGFISLYNVHLKENLAIQYRHRNGEYIPEGLRQIDQILRCRQSQEPTPIALRLIEWVDHLQDYFGAEKIEVVSGYRSPQLNAQLRREGRKVAKYSHHILGEAMDIRLPGVATKKIRDYLLAAKQGGVGYYPGQNFVHVDVGPVRSW